MKQCTLEDLNRKGTDYEGGLERTIKYQICPDFNKLKENLLLKGFYYDTQNR